MLAAGSSGSDKASEWCCQTRQGQVIGPGRAGQGGVWRRAGDECVYELSGQVERFTTNTHRPRLVGRLKVTACMRAYKISNLIRHIVTLN